MLALDKLTDTQFEEFCFCLVEEAGFVNVDWRKGTPLDASPADQGRDIVAQWKTVDVTGSVTLDTWFMDCKHYAKGVPPEKIQSLLSWAEAEQPRVALIIASGFLSNPAKEYLGRYKENRRPPFEIKVWERPQLEKLCLGKTKLLRKFGLAGAFPFLDVMHPAHLLYVREPCHNKLSYFFDVLRKLDPAVRDEMLQTQYHAIIRPRYREPVSADEKIGDLIVDEVSFRRFEEKCDELCDSLSQYDVVYLVVSHALQQLFHGADQTSYDRFLSNYQSIVESVKTRLSRGEVSRRTAEKEIAFAEMLIDKLPRQMEKAYELYTKFCDEVVLELFNEPVEALKLPAHIAKMIKDSERLEMLEEQ